jgi:lipopolysaccharide transport system permease protein
MLNPMTRIIDMLRGSVIYSTIPAFGDVTYIIVTTLLLLIVGYAIFVKFEPGFAEEM